MTQPYQVFFGGVLPFLLKGGIRTMIRHFISANDSKDYLRGRLDAQQGRIPRVGEIGSAYEQGYIDRCEADVMGDRARIEARKAFLPHFSGMGHNCRCEDCQSER
jgi:hypothetical protein